MYKVEVARLSCLQTIFFAGILFYTINSSLFNNEIKEYYFIIDIFLNAVRDIVILYVFKHDFVLGTTSTFE